MNFLVQLELAAELIGIHVKYEYQRRYVKALYVFRRSVNDATYKEASDEEKSTREL